LQRSREKLADKRQRLVKVRLQQPVTCILDEMEVGIRQVALVSPSGRLEALEAAGLSEIAVVRSGGKLDYQQGFEIGLEAAEDFAALADKPTAVIATSDDMAISFMSRMQHMGLNVPGDLSIVSFDGAPVCEFCSPPLSTIEQPVNEMGQAAVTLLLAAIGQAKKQPAVCKVVRSRLILQQSVAIPKNGA
jgi:DNA-binding LacI/PurR family transcriptional regulator